MASYFTWLDHRPQDSDRVREALRALDQPGTIDPLGFGSVRDAFSELLFPGLSTVMTRARYFLFVPWIYEQIGQGRSTRRGAAARARQLEIDLIYALLKGSESHRGIIGQNSRDNTKQLPSIIYWGGLRSLGIRQFDGTRTDYVATADAYHRRLALRWHPSLPEPPEGWLEEATLDMTAYEAEFLRDRILRSAPHTLFSALARDADSPIAEDLLWDHPLVHACHPSVRDQIEHARLFAIATWGAGLLYNLELDRLRVQDLATSDDLPSRFRDDLADWVLWMQELSEDLAKWDRDAMWATVGMANASVRSSRPFVDWWLDLVIFGDPAGIDTPEVRRSLRNREIAIKGTRSKLANRRAREQSQGSSGEGLMTFRWPIARTIITDIVEATS